MLGRLLDTRSTRHRNRRADRLADSDGDDQSNTAPVVRLRGIGVDVLNVGWDPRDQLRPGDLIVVDDRTRIFRSGVVDVDGIDTADDVLEAILVPATAHPSTRRGGRGSGPGNADTETAPKGRAVRVEPDDWPENDRDQVRKILDMVGKTNLTRPSRDDRDTSPMPWLLYPPVPARDHRCCDGRSDSYAAAFATPT